MRRRPLERDHSGRAKKRRKNKLKRRFIDAVKEVIIVMGVNEKGPGGLSQFISFKIYELDRKLHEVRVLYTNE